MDDTIFTERKDEQYTKRLADTFMVWYVVFFLLILREAVVCSHRVPIRLLSHVSVVINGFYPKTDPVPSTCHTGTSYPPTPCLFHREDAKSPVFRDCTLIVLHRVHNCREPTNSTEQDLRLHSKISSRYSWGLYLRALYGEDQLSQT